MGIFGGNSRKILVIKRSIVIVIALVVFFAGAYVLGNKIGQRYKVDATNLNKSKLVKSANIDKSKEKDDKAKGESVVNGFNVTRDGDKYTFDAVEVHDVLIKAQAKVDGKKIAFLTFDDGPSTTITPRILQILKENGVHATFCVVGKEIEKNIKTQEILKQELYQGNAIGNHTYSHNYNNLYPGGVVNVDNFMAEINKTNEILKNVLGANFHTRVIRMPGGHMSWRGTLALDNRFNEDKYTYIDWNDLTKDSEGRKKNKDELIENLKKYFEGQERFVLLMHDTYGKESTVEALPEVIKFLKEQGYEFKTLK